MDDTNKPFRFRVLINHLDTLEESYDHTQYHFTKSGSLAKLGSTTPKGVCFTSVTNTMIEMKISNRIIKISYEPDLGIIILYKYNFKSIRREVIMKRPELPFDNLCKEFELNLNSLEIELKEIK